MNAEMLNEILEQMIESGQVVRVMLDWSNGFNRDIVNKNSLRFTFHPGLLTGKVTRTDDVYHIQPVNPLFTGTIFSASEVGRIDIAPGQAVYARDGFWIPELAYYDSGGGMFAIEEPLTGALLEVVESEEEARKLVQFLRGETWE